MGGSDACSVCENRKWRCTEKVCDGVCRTVGEGHYISFDGLKYSFPGLCQYVLVQVGDDVSYQSWYTETRNQKTQFWLSFVFTMTF